MTKEDFRRIAYELAREDETTEQIENSAEIMWEAYLIKKSEGKEKDV